MDSELSRPLTKNELISFEKLKLKWKELSVEDVILDGLYLNCIRLVKEYFEKVLKMDLKSKKINDIGLKSVLQLLADKDLRGAEKLLNHMKLNFDQKIYQICFFTPYKQLRDYLISVLIDRKILNEHELEIVEFLKKFELTYACGSYELVKKQITPFKNLNLNWSKLGSNEKGLNSTRNENFQCKELIRMSNDSKTTRSETTPASSRYSHTIIEWIRDWPSSMQNEILFESLIFNKELKKTEIQLLNDDSTLWTSLLEFNKLDLIFKWIDYSFGKNAPITNEDEDCRENLFREKLTKDMIEQLMNMKTLTDENKELILNQLASYDVYLSDVEKNFSKLIHRLSASGRLFDHRLFKLKDEHFHLKLIASLISSKKNIPVNFLWNYLNYYNKINDHKDSQALLLDCQQIELNTSNCLKMTIAFRQNLYLTELDPSNYFLNACIKNFENVLNQTENMQISSLFQLKFKEYHLLALAMSLYLDTPLSSNESSKLEHLFDEYPSLRLMLDSKISYQPTSLYSLLQEHTKFDVAKFFTWQKSNNISFFKQDDKLKQTASTSSSSNLNPTLLSFENQEFAKRFSYKDSLDYAYFVKEGRPFFAYHYFISKQIKKYGKLNKILMEEAYLRTSLILMENFQDSRVASSCLMFTELMNADSFKLKLNVHLMNILTEYYIKKGKEPREAAENCKNVFVEFFKEDIEAKQILALFENVLVTNIVEHYDKKNMFTLEACSLWLPLMCFSKIYHLPYSTKYLQLCAESNEWLMYLLFAQLYQIPRFQIINCLEHFTDIGLKQHLEYALHNVITSTAVAESSSTSSLVTNKIKNVFKINKLTSMINASGWFKSRKRSKLKRKVINAYDSSDNDDSDNENDQLKQSEEFKESLDSVDFYELLIECQNSSDPVLRLQLEALKWYTPVLAVFATFYQQHDKISCLCTFLYASIKHQLSPAKMRHIQNIENNTNKNDSQSVLFVLSDLKEAVQIAACKSYLRTLLNALRIFIPKTILDIYAEFLYMLFVNKDPNRAQTLYANYKYELIKVTLNKHQSYIPLEWYEEVINKLTRITILKCHTIDDLQHLTNILGASNEYRRLIKLVYILKSNKISVFCEEWLDINDKSDHFNEICFRVIEELLKMQKFNEAEELADFCELSKDRIHLARIGRQIEILRLNNDFEEILGFWKSAHIHLMKIGIKDTDFIDFLKLQSSRSNLMLERIVLLNLICQLCPNDNENSKNLWNLLLRFVVDQKKKNETHNVREIFKKMLLFGRLKDDPVKELIEYIIKENRVNDFSDSSTILNDQDKEALNILLYNLVDIGKLTQAYVIAKHFKYFNQDFRILLNIIYLCLDMVKLEDLDYINNTLDTTSFKGIKLTNVLRSMSRPADLNENIKDKINFLQKLVGLCKYGNKFSKRIKLDFELAYKILNSASFIQVLNENQWNLLKLILYSDYGKKFDIAREFVQIHDLNANRLADFILEELMSMLANSFSMTKTSFTGASVAGGSSKQMMLDPMNNAQFSELIKIFDKDVNLFGNKLLDKSRSLLNDAKSGEEFSILTELLVKSHDCFIQSCSMEGISNVLETCKLCATKLEKAGEFNLLIRLLTGVGHYNEMTYIMDYLWNNHQFEMLFGRRTGKEEKLRLALMNYLKRYHPNDHETYTMVTLNFTMHREIANMLEEAAYEQLKLLENKQLENTSEILTDLQSIQQYFSDAAQSYMKEDCVKQAEFCIKKARLIALQINFLSSNVIIINLNASQVSKFVVNHAKFWEAFIVSEAYEKKASDWPQALFNQFILNNNEKYFLDFKAHLQLNSNVFEDVSNRYKIYCETNKPSKQSTDNLKRLIKCSKDLHQYYRLITSLEFHDLIKELQSKKYFSIINDLVMNKKL